MEKEYGKLTEDQFKRLIRALSEVRKESKRTEEAMRAASREKLREMLGGGISWSAIYEVSLTEGTAHLMLALGYADRVMAALQHKRLRLDLAKSDGKGAWEKSAAGAIH